MKLEDIKLVSRAIEFMYYGVDITSVTDFSQFYNSVTKKFQQRTSPNVKHVTVFYDQECTDFMEHVYGPYIIRTGTNSATCIRSEEHLTPEEKEVIIKVNKDMLLQTMSILYKNSVTSFSGYTVEQFDMELLKELEEEAKNWDYSVKRSCKMMDTLTKENIRQNLEVMLTMCNYPDKVCKQVIEAFDTDDEESFGKLKDFTNYKIIDNRMYIPLNKMDKMFIGSCSEITDNVKETDYIVISRNPYDFFFCSWGSAIQTCFSLNSPHMGGYGMYPFSANKGCFLIYGTHGRGTETAVISGKKWKCPHMSWRCWGWLDTNGYIRLDRLYPVLNDGSYDFDKPYKKFYNLLEKFFHYRFDDNHDSMRVELEYDTQYQDFFNEHSLYCYLDSINTSGYYCGVCHGYRDFTGRNKPRKTPLDMLKNIKEVDKNFRYTTNYFINSLGVLAVQKTCPITQILIPDSMEKSFYSKFFKEAINGLIVVSYCDGYIKLDDSSFKRITGKFAIDTGADSRLYSDWAATGALIATPMWSTVKYPLKPLKEWIKQHIAEAPCDNILLRVIEEDRVQYIKYRK